MTYKILAGFSVITLALAVSLMAFANDQQGNPPPFNCQNGDGEAVELSIACQSLDNDVTKQICDPYLDANAFSLCKQYVDADADAYCRNYVNAEVDVEVENRIDDITNICGGDHDFTAVAVKLADISNKCLQGQQQAAFAKNICEDSSVNAFNAAQICKNYTTVNLECPNTTVSVDERPADCRRCKTKRQYFPDGAVKLEVTRCRGCTFDAETSVTQD